MTELSFDKFAKVFRFPPTSEQEAVIKARDPRMLVVAGAGSGKTQTMSQRIAWHIASGNVEPQKVLGLTFTRKAAGELAQRVRKYLPPSARSSLDRPTISTYNSFASNIATSYALLIGKDPRAQLLTEAARWQLVSQIVDEWSGVLGSDDVLLDKGKSTVVDTVLHLAGEMTDHGVSPDEAREFLTKEIEALEGLNDVKNFRLAKFRGTGASQGFASLYKGLRSLHLRLSAVDIVERYFEIKNEKSYLDYSDQVAWAGQILAQAPQVREELRSQYSMVLLDEYQDTSMNQANFLNNAFGPLGGNGEENPVAVCAVGDPNQAIYGWRGAGANALSDFVSQFQVPPAGIYTLSTAFRNGTRILDTANALMHGLNPSIMGLDEMPKLKSLGSKAAGEVIHIHADTDEQQYRAIAQKIASNFADHRARYDSEAQAAIASGATVDPYEPPSAAVLVRKSKYAEPMIAALEECGLEYEHIGGEKLVTVPEVRVLRALLNSAFVPSRGDELMIVMNFFAVSPKDLRALRQYLYQIEPTKKADKPRDAFMLALNPSLVDGLERLVQDVHEGNTPKTDSSFTESGLERLLRIAQMLRILRLRADESLPAVVELAISLLNLYGYANARSKGGAKAKRVLSKFTQMAAEFVPLADRLQGGALVRDFLLWLEAVESKEQGGDDDSSADAVPLLDEELLVGDDELEPEPGVVQILTVHKAKGLEWDIVAIPEMVSGEFDAAIESEGKPWNTDGQALPYPLRQDRSHLPTFSAQIYVHLGPLSEDDAAEVGVDYAQFKSGELIDYRTAENRRLAYVAITRPRSVLYLGSYDQRAEKLRKVSQGAKPVEDKAHVFLDEIHQQAAPSTIDSVQVEPIPAAVDSEGTVVETIENLRWPTDVDRSLDLGQIAAYVPADNYQEVWQQAATRAVQERESEEVEQASRDHLTASAVVAMMKNPEKYALDVLRPIPQEPTEAASRGSAVHAAIAHYFGYAATLDIDSLVLNLGFDDEEAGAPAFDRGITSSAEQELYDRFQDSRFAHYPPLAIETTCEIALAGKPIRCVIDAVFDTSQILGARPITIVDWKTGKRPSKSEVEKRAYQLALYRLAWSATHGVPLEDVDACFYYLGEKDPARREVGAGSLTQEQVESQILAKIEEGAQYLRELSTGGRQLSPDSPE